MGEYIGIDVGKATLHVCFSDKVTPLSNSASLIKNGCKKSKKIGTLNGFSVKPPGGMKEPLSKHCPPNRYPYWLKEINQLTAESEMQEKVNLLTSIPAIGQQTALMILTLLPEIGSIENKSLAALVGVAPFNRDSGKFRGKRFIQGGRKTLRKALYMVAVAAKPLADFYHRLRAKGKCGKVAIVAVMHKLLSMVSSVYKRKSPWVENFA